MDRAKDHIWNIRILHIRRCSSCRFIFGAKEIEHDQKYVNGLSWGSPIWLKIFIGIDFDV